MNKTKTQHEKPISEHEAVIRVLKKHTRDEVEKFLKDPHRKIPSFVKKALEQKLQELENQVEEESKGLDAHFRRLYPNYIRKS